MSSDDNGTTVQYGTQLGITKVVWQSAIGCLRWIRYSRVHNWELQRWQCQWRALNFMIDLFRLEASSAPRWLVRPAWVSLLASKRKKSIKVVHWLQRLQLQWRVRRACPIAANSVQYTEILILNKVSFKKVYPTIECQRLVRLSKVDILYCSRRMQRRAVTWRAEINWYCTVVTDWTLLDNVYASVQCTVRWKKWVLFFKAHHMEHAI